MPQVWALVLESFQTVSVGRLVEARIIENLIKAFLRAPEDIQQSTIPRILAISEGIAADAQTKDAGKLLSNLIFTTLAGSLGNPALETVGQAVCSGWLDIIISGAAARPTAHDPALEGVPIHVNMEVAEVSALLRRTAKFLRTHLNQGSFEGATGAQRSVVTRLTLASDLLLVAFNVRSKEGKGLAVTELEAATAQNPALAQEYQTSLDDLVGWLFLNARGPAEEQAPSGLGNVSLQTPASARAKRITD